MFKKKIAGLLVASMMVCNVAGCGQQKQDAANSGTYVSTESKETKQNVEEKKEITNLFQYMVDLSGDKYAYAPQGLQLGMSVAEVVKAEEIDHYSVDADGNVDMYYETELTDIAEGMGTVIFKKWYSFEAGYGLSRVSCSFRVSKDDKDALLDLLDAQAKEYMPELEDTLQNKSIKAGAEWEEDLISVEWDETKKIEKDIHRTRTECAFHVNSLYGTDDYLISLGVGFGFYWSRHHLMYDNFFAYAVDLEAKDYTYAPVLVKFGMDKDEIVNQLDSQNLSGVDDMVISSDDTGIHTKMFYQNMPDALQEFTFEKDFTFDEDDALTKVAYTIIVNNKEYATLCEVLSEQAKEHMPEATTGSAEDIRAAQETSWSAKNANGETTSYVDVKFADAGEEQKAVTVVVYIE